MPALTVALLLIAGSVLPAPATAEDPYTRTVHFELTAPEARIAFLCGSPTDWKCDALPMLRTGKGVFHLNAPLAPGRIEYVFVVDGERRLDPMAPSEDDGRGGRRSWFVLDDDREALPLEGIARGRIESHAIRSAALGDERLINVYTPPGYSRRQSYPVLFLLHGYGMDQEQWLAGGIQNYLDRYIAAKRLEPLIVVMPGAPDEFYMGAAEEYVIGEVYPYVARHFRIRPGKGAAAVGGMSMGGYGALYLACRHAEIFRHAMVLSPVGPDARFLDELSTALQGGARVTSSLDIRTGLGDELSYPYSERLAHILSFHDAPHDYEVTRGGHDWNYWHSVMGPALLRVQRFFSRGSD